MNRGDILDSSFRDPSGSVYIDSSDNTLKRSVNQCYSQQFDFMISSGLSAVLTERRELVPFEYDKHGDNGEVYATIIPERLAFISYPSEWSFAQLQDAAVLTLDVMLTALEHGMVLKDASAYNVQFDGSQPIFIDTLSFDFYEEGLPWVAYRQFCKHFLAPLALMSYISPSMSKLWLGNIDGIDLELCADLLPLKSRANLGILTHLFIHSRSEKKNKGTSLEPENTSNTEASDGKSVKGRLPKDRLIVLLKHLRSTVSGLKNPGRDTEWGDYYNDTNYTGSAASEKSRIITDYLKQVSPTVGWDIGCNIGEYSKLLRETCSQIVAWDVDHTAINDFYTRERAQPVGDIKTLPLILDLFNPTPGIGWACKERDSAFDREKPDLVMALALIHHLAISNNVPLGKIAELFASISQYLIIEFVPKTDTQVIRLLRNREDVFDKYTIAEFESAFQDWFVMEQKNPIAESDRVMYLLKRK